MIFFLYGAATASVFNFLFFPQGDPAAAIAAFGVYAVGFLVRPVGGIVCGHFGDKIGRKSMLVLTLLLMGVSTFLIGLLPVYAAIGIRAPILLVALRVVQGFGVGGGGLPFSSVSFLSVGDFLSALLSSSRRISPGSRKPNRLCGFPSLRF